mmetsp:Transcript_4557/g.15724  ORF Transcript_4557/g.15724 Transcript_4557/m.15724 type:complete len:251 (-) Transcript_4557:402-1154(-)
MNHAAHLAVSHLRTRRATRRIVSALHDALHGKNSQHALRLRLDCTQEALLHLVAQRIHLRSETDVRLKDGEVALGGEEPAHLEQPRLDALHELPKLPREQLIEGARALEAAHLGHSGLRRCVGADCIHVLSVGKSLSHHLVQVDGVLHALKNAEHLHERPLFPLRIRDAERGLHVGVGVREEAPPILDDDCRHRDRAHQRAHLLHPYHKIVVVLHHTLGEHLLHGLPEFLELLRLPKQAFFAERLLWEPL